jgi:hypothetical protein
MSIAALALNLLLAGLLLAALVIGVRLERRLKAVREGQLAFTQAVTELDQAATKARQGLAELRLASDESTDLLGSRITRARDAADRLEKLLGRAEMTPSQPVRPAATSAATPSVPEAGLAALLQQLRDSETAKPMQAAAQNLMSAQNPMAERPLRLRRPADDDLFDDAGGRA